MPNFIAVVGIGVRKIKESAETQQEAEEKIRPQLKEGEEIFNLEQSEGSATSGG